MGASHTQVNCLFCKIIAKQIPATVVNETDEYIAIRDINPQAPTHVLILPKTHVGDVTEVESRETLGLLLEAAVAVAKAENLADGFRLVVNTGLLAGQSVFHLHIHLMGGRVMHWPPG
ncbi:MAG: HIT domain-containing protein [Candidatus Melainabacteria bacterium]|nr:HIT domain-containing protein [Candidatus Melainabacteria bacterium]